MKPIWIAAGVVAALGVGAYVYVVSSMPDLGPAGANRGLAPDTIAVYVEAPDLATTWTKMRTTEAWRDFEASKAMATLRDQQVVKDFLAALDQVAAKAAYPLDAANAMKFFGRECSVGVEIDENGGAPRLLVLTKLDVDALKKDFVHGKTDLSALWDELQRRTGQCDFVVTREDYRGHVVAVAARGASKFHAALLGDTLAVATDGGLLRRAVDCRADRGEKSLGRRPEFTADFDAVSAGAAVVEWYDVAALDARRAGVDAGLASLGASPSVVGGVHGVLDGVRGARSVARATSLPDGDLYRMTCKFSKSDGLFADGARPSLASTLDGDWAAYGEARGLGDVGKAWERSALRRNIETGGLAQLIKDSATDVKAKLRDLTGGAAAPARKAAAPPKSGAAGRAAVAADPSASAPAKDKAFDPFETKLAERLLAEMFVAEAAFSLDVSADKSRGVEGVRVAFAVRLGPEARLAVLAALSGLVETHAPDLTCETCGGRKLYSSKASEHRFWWTLVGDAAMFSNDQALVRRAAQSNGAADAVRPAGVAEAVAAMKPGWRACVWWDIRRTLDAVRARAKSELDRDASDMLERQTASGIVGGPLTAALYVPDDFSSIELRTRSPLGKSEDADWQRVVANSAPRDVRSFAALPESTYVAAANPAGGVQSVWFLFKTLVATTHGDLAAMESEFRSSMGMDLEKDLLPALGQEILFASTYRGADPVAKAPARGGAPIVVPGFVFGVEAADPATVKKAVDRAVALAEDKIRENDSEARDGKFVRETKDGVEILRFEPPPARQADVGVHPAAAVHDGFLFVSSEADLIRSGIESMRGKARSLLDAPAFVRAAASLDRKCSSFLFLDGSKTLDQIAVYAPQIDDSFPKSRPPYPEFPADGDQKEWRRRLLEYEKEAAETRASSGGRTRKWIDALRLVDFVGASSRVEDRVGESVLIVKFAP